MSVSGLTLPVSPARLLSGPGLGPRDMWLRTRCEVEESALTLFQLRGLPLCPFSTGRLQEIVWGLCPGQA